MRRILIIDQQLLQIIRQTVVVVVVIFVLQYARHAVNKMCLGNGVPLLQCFEACSCQNPTLPYTHNNIAPVAAAPQHCTLKLPQRTVPCCNAETHQPAAALEHSLPRGSIPKLPRAQHPAAVHGGTKTDEQAP